MSLEPGAVIQQASRDPRLARIGRGRRVERGHLRFNRHGGPPAGGGEGVAAAAALERKQDLVSHRRVLRSSKKLLHYSRSFISSYGNSKNVSLDSIGVLMVILNGEYVYASRRFKFIN